MHVWNFFEMGVHSQYYYVCCYLCECNHIKSVSTFVTNEGFVEGLATTNMGFFISSNKYSIKNIVLKLFSCF
jgi:hypothetical protein